MDDGQARPGSGPITHRSSLIARHPVGLAKRIIPCLDVTAGRVVKGVNFVGLRDAGDPVEIARRYDEQGADELAFLDITASSEGRDLIVGVVEAVATAGANCGGMEACPPLDGPVAPGDGGMFGTRCPPAGAWPGVMLGTGDEEEPGDAAEPSGMALR